MPASVLRVCANGSAMLSPSGLEINAAMIVNILLLALATYVALSIKSSLPYASTASSRHSMCVKHDDPEAQCVLAIEWHVDPTGALLLLREYYFFYSFVETIHYLKLYCLVYVKG